MAKPRAAAGIFLILGEDSFLAESALERTLVASFGVAHSDQTQVLRGDETSWTRLCDTARTGSLFVARRALVVRQAELLKGAPDDFVAYLEAPNPDVLLVLMARKVDKRFMPWPRLAKAAQVVSADPLKLAALRAHVAAELRQRQLRLPAEVVEELLDHVGQDLRRLMGEIDKLEALAHGGAALSAEEVAATLGRGLAKPLYKIGDALWKKDTVATLEMIDQVLDDGEYPPLVLGVLHRALRQLRAVKALSRLRLPPDEIAARAGVYPSFKVNDAREAARRWSEAALGRSLEAFVTADRALKLGADGRATLTAAVAAACGTA